jgi:hypothetical protein
VESRAVIKVFSAFSAGVLLALGVAIVHSRDSIVTGAVRAVPARRAASIHREASRPIVGHEDEGEQKPAPVVPPIAEARITPQPAPKKDPAPAERKKPVQLTAGVGNMHAQPAVSQQVAEAQRNPWSVPVPPPPPDSVQSPPQTSPRAQTATQPPEPHVVTLPAGTTLSVRLGESLNSDSNNEGDTFQATLDAPIVSDGFIIAERRSRVIGRVVQANRAGRVKGLATLALAVREINTTDGQRVPVETDSYEKWGSSSVRGDAAKVAGAAALGAIIGAIAGGGKGAAIGAGAGGAAGTGVALGTRGAAVSVPSESLLTFRLARPITITEKFN